MFRITGGRGFHITFENGVSVSVQFGGGNYCDNYHAEIGRDRERDQESTTAEIAIIPRYGEWLTEEFARYIGQDEDMVMGYCNTDTVFKALQWAKNYREV